MSEIDVVGHLRRCEAKFEARSKNPVVAWDCMGASSWARVCRIIAAEIEAAGLTGEQALGYLKAKAHDVRHKLGKGTNGLDFIAGLDAWTKFDEIIDPIARDKRGWIEVAGERDHFDRGIEGLPSYRRMVGINQCVSYLAREHKQRRTSRFSYSERMTYTHDIEDADKWEARRQAWLGQYHPDIFVIHKEGGWTRDDDFDFDRDADMRTCHDPDIPRARQFTPLHGTVAQHMAERCDLMLSCPVGQVHTVANAAGYRSDYKRKQEEMAA